MIKSSFNRNSKYISIKKLSFFDKVDRNWEKAWQNNVTPWETNKHSPPLEELFNKNILDFKFVPNNNYTALVPGCGSGHDCLLLSKLGFSNVIGCDLSETAVQLCSKLIIDNPEYKGKVDFIPCDFFQTDKLPKFDFIFDYLFFAAIDKPSRQLWAKSMKNHIKDSGYLTTLMFPYNSDDQANLNPDGPPYEVSLACYKNVLEPLGFELIYNEKVIDSILLFTIYYFKITYALIILT